MVGYMVKLQADVLDFLVAVKVILSVDIGPLLLSDGAALALQGIKHQRF